MKKYEVTIPFNPGPWYSVEVEAENKIIAIGKAIHHAATFGFAGKRGNATATEVK